MILWCWCIICIKFITVLATTLLLTSLHRRTFNLSFFNLSFFKVLIGVCIWCTDILFHFHDIAVVFVFIVFVCAEVFVFEVEGFALWVWRFVDRVFWILIITRLMNDLLLAYNLFTHNLFLFIFIFVVSMHQIWINSFFFTFIVKLVSGASCLF